MRELTKSTREELKQMIFEYYADECDADISKITMDTNPQDELGGDSLMFVELVELAKDKYNLDIKLQSIGKYLLKAKLDSMKDLVDIFCNVYQYENDIVNI